MSRFASGKHAWGIDDRSGLRVKYSDLRRQWDGIYVHKEDDEPQHSQLHREPVKDVMALHHARPGSNKREDATVFIRRGVVVYVRLNDVTVTP